MASWYQEHGRLSQRTMDAYNRYGGVPRNTEERCHFYRAYLEDVVPYEVVPQRIPNHLQLYDLGSREEIQLWHEGKVFMTGVVALGNNTSQTEDIAGNLAYIHWGQHREYHLFRHQCWGMFTGIHKIRFYSSRDGRNWDLTAEFHPINQVHEVVRYFEQEYERVRRH